MEAALIDLRFVTLAAVTFPLCACSQEPRPIPLGSEAQYYGYIDTGERFGVKIGDSRSNARALLEENKFEYLGDDNCSYRLKSLINCTKEHWSDVYHVREPLRHGVIYLEFKGDEITAIIWDFKLLPNADF